ncbi:MAG: zeta toxin family protein [Clostridiales bacterium]|jgi:adenylate kinase family enzyme|nr:zeta toxin family protein [Clostridiales bacterium]
MDLSKQHLIIIRGNSGSGKTTVAKALREEMRKIHGKGSTMLVSQDMIRIDILDVKDTSDNESIALIYDICSYGLKLRKNVILEGILDRWKYGEMLSTLIKECGDGVHVYYYDIPLEVTLNRHDMRVQKDMFSKEDMKSWYNQNNKLNLPNEHIFTKDVTVEKAVAKILNDCT